MLFLFFGGGGTQGNIPDCSFGFESSGVLFTFDRLFEHELF